MKIHLLLSIAVLTYSLTCSGISSGAYMSSQFHVAYSASVKGAALIAGGPYYCSQGSENTAITACMSSPLLININACINAANSASSTGKNDPVSNLASASVYIYAGTKDTVVNPGVGKDAVTFYQKFVTNGQIVTNFNTASEHAWITNTYGNACNYLGSPYINNCNLDVAGILLKQFYGNLNARVSPVASNLIPFNQANYGNVAGASMSKTGYVYVPNGCKNTKCEVHVSFHGCQQSAEVVGTKFVEYSGLNDWAESNNITVIYPQTTSEALKNPNGCWDWWGYSGADFAYKSGKQMAIVYSMTKNPPGVNWSN